MKKVFELLLVCMVIILITMDDAHAYINPGKGSHVFQLLISGILTVVYVIKNKLKSLFKNENEDNVENKD